MITEPGNQPAEHDGLHLAVMQSPAALQGTAARLTWLDQQLAQHKAAGFDLVLLPELFACGYHIGADVVAAAEAADGSVARQVAGLAQRYNLAIHYGFAERDGSNLYNAAQAFGADGSRLGGHRKLILPPGYESTYFSTGTKIDLFHYGGLSIATLICYDAEFPELVRRAACLGADLILVPTALGEQWGWVAHSMMPTRGYENGVFLAYANHAGLENGLSYLGASFIGAPNGRVLARAGAAPEVISAYLDRAMVSAAQTRLPYHADLDKIQLDPA